MLTHLRSSLYLPSYTRSCTQLCLETNLTKWSISPSYSAHNISECGLLHTGPKKATLINLPSLPRRKTEARGLQPRPHCSICMKARARVRDQSKQTPEPLRLLCMGGGGPAMMLGQSWCSGHASGRKRRRGSRPNPCPPPRINCGRRNISPSGRNGLRVFLEKSLLKRTPDPLR